MKFEALLVHPVVQSLGRALLHFLWQGVVLALLLQAVRMIAPRAAARIRYGAASLIMLMMPLALVVTATRDYAPQTPGSGSIIRAATQTRGPVLWTMVLHLPQTMQLRAGPTGWFVCIWICGVLLLSARAIGGLMKVAALKQAAQPAGSRLESAMGRMKAALRVSAAVRVCTSAVAEVPAVIGWIRPCILLPVSALTGLSESQIEAVLAHELAHIRRYDYAVNLLQSAIETLLFYHPAVWWVGKQMRLEREHCCDDIAVAICGNAFEYASALAEMEQIRGQFSAPALAVTGGDLLARIRRVLGRSEGDANVSQSAGTIASAALLVLMMGAPAMISLRAAPQQRGAAFDIASVKENTSASANRNLDPMRGRLDVSNMTLREIIAWAYSVRLFQVSGGPRWLDSTRFDIQARSEGKPGEDQIRSMLQTLLRDRFKLELHGGTSELPIYKLMTAKDGFKLRPLRQGDCIVYDPAHPPATPNLTASDFCGNLTTGRGAFEGTSATMTDLALSFSILLGRTVVDTTGIQGTYHIRLNYSPDVNGGADDDVPSIFSALQEQAGLKLVPSKGPVEVLVVDRAEKPSGN